LGIAVASGIASAVVGALGEPDLRAQAPAAAQGTANPTFEVASIKPNKSGDGRVMFGMQPGGRFTATNTPLRMLISVAYELKQEAQLVGGPADLLAAKYDITAKAEGNKTLETKELPPLLRALLADRFKLKTHTESRELPSYNLVLARSDGRLGPDLKPSTSDCSKANEILAEQGAALAKGDVASFVGKPKTCSVSTDASGGPLNLMMRGDGQEMKQLVEILSLFSGREVRDKTGLTGRYDFALKLDLRMTLELARKMGANIPPEAEARLPPSDGSSLMTALNEGLGLKLESIKGAVDVTVIDSVEAPTAD